jgi:hypothetical protein
MNAGPPFGNIPNDEPQAPAQLLSFKDLGIYRPDEQALRVEELGAQEYLVEGLLTPKSLNILVGRPGLGKSPLMYQLCCCIASGKPFLDMPVKQGRILYLDYENGLPKRHEIITAITEHLGLAEAPRDLYVCCPYDLETDDLKTLVGRVKPVLTVIDCITAHEPEIEEKNSIATAYYNRLRKVIAEFNTAIIGVHHMRKPSNHPQAKIVSLESADRVLDWLHESRGSAGIIDKTDTRLGLDQPEQKLVGSSDADFEGALIVRGYVRGNGEITPIYLGRSFDEHGGPLGFVRINAHRGFWNERQEKVFASLPDIFTFTDAKRAYERSAQPTLEFLDKAIKIGRLEKLPGKRGYRKLVIPGGTV